MKKELLYDLIEKCQEETGRIESFYITYKETENITTNKWGKFANFDSVITELEKCATKYEIPDVTLYNIERVIFYSNSNANAYIKNPSWCMTYDEWEDEYIHLNIPYVDLEGKIIDLENYSKNESN